MTWSFSLSAMASLTWIRILNVKQFTELILLIYEQFLLYSYAMLPITWSFLWIKRLKIKVIKKPTSGQVKGF